MNVLEFDTAWECPYTLLTQSRSIEAGVAELVDAMDSKSIGREAVGVQVPPPAPIERNGHTAEANMASEFESPLSEAEQACFDRGPNRCLQPGADLRTTYGKLRSYDGFEWVCHSKPALRRPSS